MLKFFAVLALGLIGWGCHRSQLSVCDWECNEFVWFNVRSEGTLSSDRLELVWNLSARPNHWRELLTLDRWTRMSVALNMPAAVLEGEEIDRSTCLGLAALDLPGAPAVGPLAVFVDSLRLTRSGNSVEVVGSLSLETITVGSPPVSASTPRDIQLTLKRTTFRLADTLSPQGDELMGSWPTECAGRERTSRELPESLGR